MKNEKKQEVFELVAKIVHLENQLVGIAAACTQMERDARIEVAIAEIKGRKPKKEAEEYMRFISNKPENYF